MRLSRFSHFVFDLDGTLLSSSPFYVAILETIFARNGLILTEEDKLRAIGLTAHSFLAEKLPEPALDDAIKYLIEQSRVDLHHIPLFDGVAPLLQGLSDRGARLAIWSSRNRGSAEELLHKHDILHYFDQTVFADCVARHKPDPEGLLKLANLFNCLPSDMVMIGDHDVDMQAAQRAGAIGIRANWHGFTPELTCTLAHSTCHSVHQLSSLLVSPRANG